VLVHFILKIIRARSNLFENHKAGNIKRGSEEKKTIKIRLKIKKMCVGPILTALYLGNGKLQQIC
jgi:hypothetical protein